MRYEILIAVICGEICMALDWTFPQEWTPISYSALHELYETSYIDVVIQD